MSSEITKNTISNFQGTMKAITLKNTKASFGLKLSLNTGNEDLVNNHMYGQKSKIPKDLYQVSKIESIDGLNSSSKLGLKKMLGSPMFNPTINGHRPFCSKTIKNNRQLQLMKVKDNMKHILKKDNSKKHIESKITPHKFKISKLENNKTLESNIHLFDYANEKTIQPKERFKSTNKLDLSNNVNNFETSRNSSQDTVKLNHYGIEKKQFKLSKNTPKHRNTASMSDDNKQFTEKDKCLQGIPKFNEKKNSVELPKNSSKSFFLTDRMLKRDQSLIKLASPNSSRQKFNESRNSDNYEEILKTNLLNQKLTPYQIKRNEADKSPISLRAKFFVKQKLSTDSEINLKSAQRNIVPNLSTQKRFYNQIPPLNPQIKSYELTSYVSNNLNKTKKNGYQVLQNHINEITDKVKETLITENIKNIDTLDKEIIKHETLKSNQSSSTLQMVTDRNEIFKPDSLLKSLSRSRIKKLEELSEIKNYQPTKGSYGQVLILKHIMNTFEERNKQLEEIENEEIENEEKDESQKKPFQEINNAKVKFNNSNLTRRPDKNIKSEAHKKPLQGVKNEPVKPNSSNLIKSPDTNIKNESKSKFSTPKVVDGIARVFFNLKLGEINSKIDPESWKKYLKNKVQNEDV